MGWSEVSHVCLLNIFSETLAGMIGVGAGYFLSLLMIHMGVHPAVSAATNAAIPPHKQLSCTHLCTFWNHSLGICSVLPYSMCVKFYDSEAKN